MAQIHNDNSTWQKYTLNKLGNYLNGRAFKKHEWKKEGLPIIRIQNLNDTTSNFNYTDKVHEPRYKVENGDLLVSWAASLGVYLWDRGDAWLNQHIFKVIPNEKLVTKDFLYYLLKSVLSELYLKTHGTGMVHITKGDFDSHEVYIPHLPEQEEIVKKLNTALPLVNTSQSNIVFAKAKLNKFRQAILSAAITGKLTEDWRENNPQDPISSTVEELKQNRLSEAKTPVNKKKVEEFYSYREESNGEELPEEWSYVSLDKLCASFQYGTSTKSSPAGKVPVLRMGNLQRGEIDWSELVYTSDENEIEKYKLKAGDVLFNRTNSPELVGKTSIYRGEQEAIFAGYLIKINNYSVLNSEYLNYCLNSQHAREYCYRVKTDGVSQSNINAQKLGKFEVPFCSPEEQAEIIRLIKQYFDAASQVEKQIEKAEARISKLTQAILAKTFRNY